MKRPSARLLAAASVVAVALAVGLPGCGGGGEPNEAHVEHDIVYRSVDGNDLTLDAYVPAANTTKRPAVVLIHSGGWVLGDKSELASEGTQLMQLGYAAFSVNYRLAPRYRYPAAVDDVRAAVEWLRQPDQIAKYRLDPSRIAALGGSAGGYLAAMLATLGEGALFDGSRVKAAVSWSGPMNFTLFDGTPLEQLPGLSAIVTFLGCKPGEPKCADKERAASPISHVDPSDAPVLLANSQNELIPVNQATSMNDALQAAHIPDQMVILPGSGHAIGYADQIWPQTLAFLGQYLGHASSEPANRTG